MCVCVCVCLQLMAAANQFLLESMRHQCEAFLSEQVDHEVKREKSVGLMKKDRAGESVSHLDLIKCSCYVFTLLLQFLFFIGSLQHFHSKLHTMITYLIMVSEPWSVTV